MNKATSKVLLLFFVLCFSHCRRSLDRPEYVSYVQDSRNGLRKVVTVNGWDYILQYKPIDYVVLSEMREAIAPSYFEERRNELQGMVWFNISFKRSDNSKSPLRYNLADNESYQNRLNYLLNEAIHDLHLLYGTDDTLFPSAYEFENNYNLAPQETIVVGFKLPDGVSSPSLQMQLSYYDQIFNNGIIKTIFSEKDLKNIPNLSF